MPKRWAALPRGTRLLLGAIAAVMLALVVAWALFVPTADWLAHHDVGSVRGALHETALDNARGRLLTLGAGLFAAGALIFTALNFNLLRRNSEKTELWQRRTHELTEEGQVTDRYTKAIEQLGSDKLDVRIGGIYALERIAYDSARDHPTVMDVLSAFVREHSREQRPPRDLPGSREQEHSARPDVQAAVTVIGRRTAERDIRRIDLTGADLSDVDLASASLHRAHLSNANLTRAILRHADLDGARLDGADLTGADLTAADLPGAILPGADLTGVTALGAVLYGADLTSADLEGADLADADLSSANLTDTHLTDARLIKTKWPPEAPVPSGWELDPGSGRLKRAGGGSDPTESDGSQNGGSSE
jgi:hypothetical protein